MSDPEQTQEDSHPVFARLLRRPVTALMAFVLIVALGVVSYQRIPIMLMPQGISEPEMRVRVNYPNASPHEVLEKVTRPLEDTIRTLPDVVRVYSDSSAGSSGVSVRFSATADMDLAYNELSDRLERTKPSLPDEVQDIRIFRFNSDVEMPIFWMGITYEDYVEDPFGVIDEVIQPRLEAVDGVAQVRALGMVLDSVRLFVSPESLRSHGISLYEMVQTLRRDNFVLPAGAVNDGDREYLLRIDASFRTLQEIREYPLKRNVQVQDVAKVEIAKSFRDEVSRVNGKSSVTALIMKESDENTVDVCNRVLAQLEVLKSDERLEGFAYNIYFNQSDMIVSALGNLKSSMSWGALFAVLILYMFVRRVTVTLMVALAIPFSLLSALVAVYFSGFAFNILSLAGFTLAIGMLVDNSVVVAENIARRRASGANIFDAAASGAGQVGLAIVLSTLTTIVVFTPMVFMAEGRNTRIFLRELAAPITYSLLASLLTALVFLPIATVYLGRARPKANTSPSGYAENSKLLGGYRKMLGFALRHRFGVTLFTLFVIWLGSVAAKNLEVSFSDGGGSERLSVDVTLPARFTLPEASDVFGEIEQFLLDRKGEYRFEDLSVRFDRRRGQVRMWFSSDDERPKMDELSNRLEKELPEIPGVQYRMGFEESNSGDGSISLQLEGPESEVLARIGEEVVRELEKLPDLANVRTDLEDGNDELRVKILSERAQRYGISQEVLQGMIAWGVGGQQIPGYRGGPREIPMIIEYEEPEVGDLNYLRALDVPVDNRGGSVPLGALTRFEFERSFGSIRRMDGITSLGVQAESYDKNSYRINRAVQEVLADFPFPEGYSWRDSGGRQEFEEGSAEIMTGLIVGVIFVFLLMGMLFEAVLLPLAVILAIPLAMVGANLALYVTSTPLDGTAQLAFILLAGIVVNNGIVLVDRIRQVRDSGRPRTEAILTGCAQRLRPVLMTALTTMFGLLPMALPKVFATNTGNGLNYQSLAIATLGGLLVSTLLTLLVVPLFYTLFDDLGQLLMRLVGLRRREKTPSVQHS